MNYGKSKRKNSLKIVISFFEKIITIIAVFICIVILTQRFSNNEKSFFGLRLFKVETGSMIPKYNINDVILAIEKNPKEIAVGDDLVYVAKTGELEGMVVTHQVIRIEEDEEGVAIYTKGIANDIEDPVVRKEQIIGIVILKSQILTIITKMLLNPYTLYFLIILPVTITLFLKEVHAKDKKERYVQKQIERNRK